MEAELSRTASRLIAMDQAQSNADQYIEDQLRLMRNTQRSIVNMRLLETITAFATYSKKRKGGSRT